MNKHDKREYRATRNRDRGRCIICGLNVTHVHHIVYRSHGGITDRRNMVCLCPTHHEQAHSDEKVWRDKLLDYLRGHYGMIDERDLKHKNKWIKAFE